jgi:hypothetical protein
MGAYTELVDFTFTANETSRTFSGLNITKDDFIKIIITHVNASSGQFCDIQCFPNTTTGVSGFDTTTNYHSQRLTGTTTQVIAARDNINKLNRTTEGNTSSAFVYFKISENGKTNWFMNRTTSNNSNIETSFDYTTSSNLTFNDPITSLTFTSTETNGLGTDSRIQIYRLDAEKVADITTTANATQVDISSLSIGKDSEYLLVSDVASISNEAFRYRLTPNDLTTESGYYVQEIQGNGTTASAARFNVPAPTFVATNTRSLVYTHIKLSEIGAFTTQNYSIDQIGSSSVLVRNSFNSSTSEAITSITKLNIFDSFSNASIASGSRFILYKLK